MIYSRLRQKLRKSIAPWWIRLEDLTLRMSFGNECVRFVPKQSSILAPFRRVMVLSAKQEKIWTKPCWKLDNFGLMTLFPMIHNGTTFLILMQVLLSSGLRCRSPQTLTILPLFCRLKIQHQDLMVCPTLLGESTCHRVQRRW